MNESLSPRVSIVMRSCNDIDTIEATLEALASQTYQDFELWSHDSSSCDGTLEVIMKYNDPARILVNDPREYVPGRVLNKAVSFCNGEIIVFLNSDATPESETWLANLIEPLNDPAVGAVFGRQTARPDCRTLFRKDTERAFGDGTTSANWVHFFSMANSATRKEIFTDFAFNPDVQYSEDIEWSLRLKQKGYEIAYVAEAAACHSHNYTLRQSFRRHFGEGCAEAVIFNSGQMNFSFTRYVLLPLGAEIARDIIWSLRNFSLDGLLHSIPLRTVQKFGRWQGLRAGLNP